MIVLPCLAAACLAVLRIAGHKEPAFQAVAHLYVGGLLGAWLADRRRKSDLAIALALSVVELACFLIGRAS